jgi:uncharacterized protein GlcG (DUF336 family)
VSIGLAEAKAIIAAAQRKAVDVGKPVTVVVVDSGGFAVASERMDGARPLTPSIAIAKAYTAAIMQRPTRMLKGWCDSQPEFFSQVSRMGHHPIVATDGGLTIKKNGQILGGVGVAGGTGEDDQEIAVAALRECAFDLEFAEWNPVQR